MLLPTHLKSFWQNKKSYCGSAAALGCGHWGRPTRAEGMSVLPANHSSEPLGTSSSELTHSLVFPWRRPVLPRFPLSPCPALGPGVTHLSHRLFPMVAAYSRIYSKFARGAPVLSDAWPGLDGRLMSEAAALAFMQAMRGCHPQSLAPQTLNIEISKLLIRVITKKGDIQFFLNVTLKKESHLCLSSRKMSF